MKLTGTITSVKETAVTFSGDIVVSMTIDRPVEKKVTVQLSNSYRADIAGTDYDALTKKWATDDDLLAFIAAKHKLTTG